MPRRREPKYRVDGALPHFSLRGAGKVLKRKPDSILKDIKRTKLFVVRHEGQGRTVWLSPDDMVELKTLYLLRESFGNNAKKVMESSDVVVADTRARAAEWYKTLIHAIEHGIVKL